MFVQYNNIFKASHWQIYFMLLDKKDRNPQHSERSFKYSNSQNAKMRIKFTEGSLSDDITKLIDKQL